MAKGKDKTAVKNTVNPEDDLAEQSADEAVNGVGVEDPEAASEGATSEPEDEVGMLRLELNEYKNLYLRKAAEFENFKRRKQLEFQTLIKSAGEALISELLPVLDDFDRFLSSEGNGDNESLLEGARLMREKLWECLVTRGLQPIESLEKPFDPELHEALMQEEREGIEPGIVLQEHLRGYRLGDRVIRHAKVVVSA
jgi:molecular chaperone GrpE